MRLWSLHPKYMDSKGLVALWRESLLAKHVLEGKTKGYRHHPQLIRFKNYSSPIKSINAYLKEIFYEAEKRGYHFNRQKFVDETLAKAIPLHQGQIIYEQQHLLNKLELRDQTLFKKFKNIHSFDPHPIFFLVPGAIEDWEIQ